MTFTFLQDQANLYGKRLANILSNYKMETNYTDYGRRTVLNYARLYDSYETPVNTIGRSSARLVLN